MTGVANRLFKSDTAQRAYRTFMQSFLGLFLISLVGWLNSVVLWANGGDGALFPHVSVLVKAGIAAMGAAVIAVISALHNTAESKGVTVPTLGK